jgi:pimeloyl-ACP methyl ester carboxylesterase
LNLDMWESQVSALSRRFRVIRYDRRGFGRSSGSEDATWDAADLEALLVHLGESKVHVLGMSQAGRVALQFARRNPDRISSLILHGATPPAGFGLPWSGADRNPFDTWARIAREESLQAFRRAWAAHPLMEVPAGRPDVRTRLAELLESYRGGRILSPPSPSGPVGPLTMDDLTLIGVPTLVLIGESEVPYLQIVAHALAYYIPDARLIVVTGGGHLVNLIEPGTYNAAVLAFLADINRSSRPEKALIVQSDRLLGAALRVEGAV